MGCTILTQAPGLRGSSRPPQDSEGRNTLSHEQPGQSENCVNTGLESIGRRTLREKKGPICVERLRYSMKLPAPPGGPAPLRLGLYHVTSGRP
jgi:hypothetical protein